MAVTPLHSIYRSKVSAVVWKQLVIIALEAAYTSVMQMAIIKCANDMDNNKKQNTSNKVFLTLPYWGMVEYKWALQTLIKVLNKFRRINLMVTIQVPGDEISTTHDMLLTKKKHKTKMEFKKKDLN